MRGRSVLIRASVSTKWLYCLPHVHNLKRQRTIPRCHAPTTERSRSPFYHSFSTSTGNVTQHPSSYVYLKPEYEYIEYIERLGLCQPHGYHPVKIGDQFRGGRYTVVQKLGYGGTSTTRLAADQRTEKLVAIKIKNRRFRHLVSRDWVFV